MPGTVLYLHHLTIFMTPQSNSTGKLTQIYLSKVTQLINGGISAQNQACVTPKSNSLSTLSDYFLTLDWKSDLSLTTLCVLEPVSLSQPAFPSTR